MVVYLIKVLFNNLLRQTWIAKKTYSFGLKKSSTNTSTMLLLYVILNLWISGKLNKIFI